MAYAADRLGGLVFPGFLFVFVFVFVLVVVHIYVAYASVRPGGLVFPGFLGEGSSCAIPVYQHRTHLNVI